MHTPSSTSATNTLAAPQMETSLESKFSAAFEQQIGDGGSGGNSTVLTRPSSQQLLFNGGARSKVPPLPAAAPMTPSSTSSTTTTTTTATPHTESGEKTVSFRKGNDLESFESLSSLFANGLFTDLVICCPGKMFKCHRVVMAAASLYIRDALSAFYNNSPDGLGGSGPGAAGSGGAGPAAGACNNCNTVMILPNDIKMADMEAILRFIYDGHVEVKVDSIESFLRSARMLNIKGLCNVNIVFNNNGSASNAADSNVEISGPGESRTHKNNGYKSMLNGHAAPGLNSPPPSPPPASAPSASSAAAASALLNSSLASLKAMAAANQHPPHHHALHSLPNGNHHHIGNKFLNGAGFNNQMINQHHYRNNLSNNHHHSNSNKRDQSPLRNSASNESSILGPGHVPAPAHQSSTPKSLYGGAANGGNSLFPPGNSNQPTTSLRFDSALAVAAAAAAAAANSTTSAAAAAASGSRRKQKYPTNIPFLAEMLPPAATAFYNTWLNMTNSEEEDEEDDLEDEGAGGPPGAPGPATTDKRLLIKDDSSNDCASTVDNLSVTSLDSRPVLPFSAGAPVPSPFAPQMPCMIEVEADPTTFPTFSDFNDAAASTPVSATSKRRRPFKSPFGDGGTRNSERHAGENKRLKLPFGSGSAAPNSAATNSIDVSIVKPASPLVPATGSNSSSSATAASHQQQTPPSENKKTRPHSAGAAAAADKQPLFTAYSAVKTAAGANPSAGGPGSSPSSNSSASGGGGGGGSWIGSKWKCDICNKYYGNKQTLKEHMDYFHSNREEQIYICNICNKEYTWRKSLMKHYRDIHQMRNTPQLAEINRQLAALSSAKVRTAVANVPPGGSPGDPLQQYVSIANYSNRKPGSKSGGGGGSGGGGSASSEKSNKSESEVENDNTNDALMGEEEDYGNDLDGIDGRSCTTEPELLSDDAPAALVVAPSGSEPGGNEPGGSPADAKEDATEDRGDETSASAAAASEEEPPPPPAPAVVDSNGQA